jgi:ElaA protein
MNLKLEWRFKTFEELSKEELYALLRLRCEVFVLEQNCNFLDLDNKDQKCLHVCGYRDDTIMAVPALFRPGMSYEYPSIGRIAVSAERQGRRVGIELLNVSIGKAGRAVWQKRSYVSVRSLYLKRFYESFFFEQSGEPYLEDNLEHIEMTRQVQS